MNFLERSSIGVRIHDRDIVMVKVEKRDGMPAVVSAVQVPLGPSIIEGGVIVDAAAFARAFLEACAHAQPEAISAQEVHCVLPAAHTYGGRVASDNAGDEAARAAVEAHIQHTVPLARADVLFSYTRVPTRRAQGTEDVFFIATSREVVLGWRSFFTKQKIKPSFVFGPLAGYQALLPAAGRTKGAKNTVALLDITDTTGTVLVMGSGGAPYYSFSRVFAKKAALLADEVQDAARHVYDIHRKKVSALVLAPSFDGPRTLRAQLQKKLNIPVAVPDVHVAGAHSFPLSAVGAALCGLREYKRNAISPLFAPEGAHTLPAPEASADDTAAPTPSERRALVKQLVILAGVVAVGAALLGGAWWFQTQERTKRAQQHETLTTQYTRMQSLEVAVPVAVGEREGGERHISGRTATYTIDHSGSYAEAVANAKRLVEQDLAETERVWDTPLNAPSGTSTVAFPLEVTWLIYSHDDTRRLVAAAVEARNIHNVSYALNAITVTDIAPAGAAFTLTAVAKLALNELLPVSSPSDNSSQGQEEESKEESGGDEQETQTGVVLTTPTGWLNIRSGPGTQQEQTGRLLTGDSFTITGTSGDWYQVVLQDGSTGWVFSEFVGIE